MSATIITGYTGERHITPALDAAIYRGIAGDDSYVLAEGDQCEGSMPSVNQFTVKEGVVSLQGRQIKIGQETLAIDTCATGYLRIDLVCVRFNHDPVSLVDSASLVVIKGTEVASGNTPVAPAYNDGVIDEGANTVDFPLYQVNMNGGTVTYDAICNTVMSLSDCTNNSGSKSITIQATTGIEGNMFLTKDFSSKTVRGNAFFRKGTTISSSTDIFIIPEGYRPKAYQNVAGFFTTNGNAASSYYGIVYTDGKVRQSLGNTILTGVFSFEYEYA